MAQITFLGTSASIPSKNRDNTSFVFQHKKDIFLIDCPGSPAHKLLRAGFNFKKIKNVIITHHHPDHIYGIISFIHTQGFVSKKPIIVFTNPLCIKIIKQLINIFGLQRKQFPKVNFINVFTKEYFYKKSGLALTALPNKHTKGSFGIKFVFAKKAFFYSSDTAFLPSLLSKAKPFDYLIHDCTASGAYFKKHPPLNLMHTCAKQLAEWLKKHKRPQLIPVHFLTVEKNEEKRIRNDLAGVKKRVVWVNDWSKLSF